MDLEGALSWIAEIFEEAVDDIRPETSSEDIPAWDSLGVLTLMAALDEEFDIQLSDEEIQELRIVEDILAVFERHGLIQ
ncbi:MAG: acyl carrier protein [Methanosarcinaceae archaeon]|nr:acyl carrier protein [Methanosarcinaceae archaeon]